MSDKTTTPVHYWLCSAELLFISKENAEKGAAQATLNVVFTTNEQKLKAKDLTQAQQGAQQQFFSRLTEEQRADFQVVDVVFNSFSHLGFMSPAEFLGTTDEEIAKGMAQGSEIAKAANGSDTVQ